MKKIELICQKMTNFRDYIATLKITGSDVVVVKIDEFLIDPARFMFGVKELIYKYKDNLDQAIEEFAKLYGLDTTQLRDEQKDKICRYLSFFIQMCD